MEQSWIPTRLWPLALTVQRIIESASDSISVVTITLRCPRCHCQMLYYRGFPDRPITSQAREVLGPPVSVECGDCRYTLAAFDERRDGYNGVANIEAAWLHDVADQRWTASTGQTPYQMEVVVRWADAVTPEGLEEAGYSVVAAETVLHDAFGSIEFYAIIGKHREQVEVFETA